MKRRIQSVVLAAVLAAAMGAGTVAEPIVVSAEPVYEKDITENATEEIIEETASETVEGSTGEGIQFDGYTLDVKAADTDENILSSFVAVKKEVKIGDEFIQSVVADSISDIRNPQYLYAFSTSVEENSEDINAQYSLKLSDDFMLIYTEVDDAVLRFFEIRDGKVTEIEDDSFDVAKETGEIDYAANVGDSIYVVMVDAPAPKLDNYSAPQFEKFGIVMDDEQIEGEENQDPNKYVSVENVEYSYDDEKTVMNTAYANPGISKYINPQISQMPLRNQNPYGTCWAFATTAVAEANYLKKTNKYRDLSELAVVYSTFNSTADPLGNSSLDKVTPTVSNYYDKGGNPLIAGLTLATWQGLLDESKYRYGTDDNILNTKNLTSAQTRDDAVHLESFSVLDYTDRNALKTKILENGAITISYFENEKSNAYFNSQTDCYYCPIKEGSNHSVTVVGWDDNFAAGNFTNNPGGNGAWLIRNSWTSSDKMLYSHNGYFWLSYYDKSIDLAVAMTVADANNYDYNYQYDGSNYVTGYTVKQNSQPAANIFKVSGLNEVEYLNAVGFFVCDPQTEYTVDIYKNIPSGYIPTYGAKIYGASVSGKALENGFYTVKLNREVKLKKGENYAIVVTFKSANSITYFPVEAGYNFGHFKVEAYSNMGESFYEYNGKWYNYYGTFIRPGNICIKGFTKKASNGTGNVCDVTFDPGNGKCSTAHKEVTPGTAIGDLPIPSYGKYTFTGWYTQSSGGKKITETTKITDDMRVFAHWGKQIKYTISFDKNRGSGSMKNISVAYAGKTVKLPANKFKRTGYTFAGWNTKKNGKGKSYKNKQKVSALTAKNNATVKLYAQWKVNQYTIQYNGNGGTGTMANQTLRYNQKQSLAKNTFTKKGKKFAGWATSKKDAKKGKVKYKNGAKVKNMTAKNKGKVTLYAVWKKK